VSDTAAMTWSYGDWHEDRVALYDDSDDTMVCWLQKQGGVKAESLALIKAAPELLTALTAIKAVLWSDSEDIRPVEKVIDAAIAKAEGRSE